MIEQSSYAWTWWLIQPIPFTRLLINTSLGLVVPLLRPITETALAKWCKW